MPLTKCEETMLKKLHIVWFHLYGILEKIKLWGSKKYISCYQGLVVVEGMCMQSQKDFGGSENILFEIVTVGKYHYTFVQTHTIYSTKSGP